MYKCVYASVSVICQCATDQHTLNSLQQQILSQVLYVGSLGRFAGSQLQNLAWLQPQGWQKTFSSGDLMEKNLLLSSPGYQQNTFPCSRGTDTFRFLQSITGSPSAPRGCPHFLAMGLSIGQFAAWQLASSRPQDRKRASLHANGVKRKQNPRSDFPLRFPYSLVQEQSAAPSTVNRRGCAQRQEHPQVELGDSTPRVCPLSTSVSTNTFIFSVRPFRSYRSKIRL